jgi:hypothetical protein
MAARRRGRRARAIIPLIGIAVAAACSGCTSSTPADDAATVRDSSGVRIVSNAGTRGRIWDVAAAPFLDIRAGLRPAATRGVTRLRDGRIAVADAESHEVHWYSASGVLEKRSGGSGREPGRFSSIWLVGRTATDTLVLWDIDLHRLSWMAGDGGVGRVREAADLPAGTVPWNVFADGALLVTFRRGVTPPGAGQTVRDSTVLWRWDPGSGRQRALVQEPGTLWWQGPGGLQAVPFTANATFTTAGNDVLVASGPEHRIERRDGNGRLRARYSEARPPSAVRASERRAERERLLRGLTDAGALAARTRELALLPFPEQRPAYDRLLVDAVGAIWARDDEPAADRVKSWTVFDSSGVIVARVRTPPFLEIQEIGVDEVLGVGRDAAGVEHIWGYRLVRAGAR